MDPLQFVTELPDFFKTPAMQVCLMDINDHLIGKYSAPAGFQMGRVSLQFVRTDLVTATVSDDLTGAFIQKHVGTYERKLTSLVAE